MIIKIVIGRRVRAEGADATAFFDDMRDSYIEIQKYTLINNILVISVPAFVKYNLFHTLWH